MSSTPSYVPLEKAHCSVSNGNQVSYDADRDQWGGRSQSADNLLGRAQPDR